MDMKSGISPGIWVLAKGQIYVPFVCRTGAQGQRSPESWQINGTVYPPPIAGSGRRADPAAGGWYPLGCHVHLRRVAELAAQFLGPSAVHRADVGLNVTGVQRHLGQRLAREGNGGQARSAHARGGVKSVARAVCEELRQDKGAAAVYPEILAVQKLRGRL